MLHLLDQHLKRRDRCTQERSCSQLAVASSLGDLVSVLARLRKRDRLGSLSAYQGFLLYQVSDFRLQG